MKIADVMTPDLDTVSPSDTLRTAARLMADLDSGALPVGEDSRLIGTITGHDIAVQVAAEGLDPGNTTVKRGDVLGRAVLFRKRERRGSIGKDAGLVGPSAAGGEPR